MKKTQYNYDLPTEKEINEAVAKDAARYRWLRTRIKPWEFHPPAKTAEDLDDYISARIASDGE